MMTTHASGMPEEKMRAAVLLPLLHRDGTWHVLFQQRSRTVELQPGDVCFPGGHTENNETPEETVLREVSEELKLAPANVELIRRLPDRPGPAGLTVTPFVGILHDYVFAYDPAEVDHVFTAPLSSLKAVRPDVYEVASEPVIWGFTARLLTEFLNSDDALTMQEDSAQ